MAAVAESSAETTSLRKKKENYKQLYLIDMKLPCVGGGEMRVTGNYVLKGNTQGDRVTGSPEPMACIMGTSTFPCMLGGFKDAANLSKERIEDPDLAKRTLSKEVSIQVDHAKNRDYNDEVWSQKTMEEVLKDDHEGACRHEGGVFIDFDLRKQDGAKLAQVKNVQTEVMTGLGRLAGVVDRNGMNEFTTATDSY